MKIGKKKYLLLIILSGVFFCFLLTNRGKSQEKTFSYFEITINNPISSSKNEDIFLNIDPLTILVTSSSYYPKASFFIENSSKKPFFLFEKEIKIGNNIYPLDFLLQPDIYTLKIETPNNIYTKKFSVKNAFLKYQMFYPINFSFFYPNWQILDNEILEKIYLNLLNKIEDKIKVIVSTRDQKGAQFAVILREIKEKNKFDFKNYIQDLERKEKEILFNLNFIQEHRILKEEINTKEASYQLETLSNGILYFVFSKSFLIENILKQKYLITFNFTFPSKDLEYYQSFINFIFKNLKY